MHKIKIYQIILFLLLINCSTKNNEVISLKEEVKISSIDSTSIEFNGIENINELELRKDARHYIILSSVWVGGQTYNWQAYNKDKNRAIKFTVKYWNGSYTKPKRWNRTFTLEPGQTKTIGLRSNPRNVISASVAGARFIN